MKATKSMAGTASVNRVSGAQQAHIDSYRNTKAGLQTRFQEPVAVNPEKINDDITKAKNPAAGSPFPQGMYHVGHFIPRDAQDTYFDTLEDLVDPATGNSKWGKISANPKELVEFATQKADKAVYLDQLRTAEYLVNPDDPRTIQDLYRIYPELEKVPEAWYTDYQALQWTLRDLLQYGKIESAEHHNLIMYVCAPGFIIPTFPAWDPLGAIISKTDTYQQTLNAGIRKSGWSPFKYASEGQGGQTAQQKEQDEIKCLIIRRLYPGCKKMSNAEIQQFVLSSAQTSNANGKPSTIAISERNERINSVPASFLGAYTGALRAAPPVPPRRGNGGGNANP